MFWAGRIRQIELPLIFVHEPCPDRAVKRANVVKNLVTFVSGQIGIEHDVTYLAVGLQVLREDIDIALQKHLVQSPQYSRHVAVNMAESRATRTLLQLDLRK